MKKMLVGLMLGAMLASTLSAQSQDESRAAEAYYHFAKARSLDGSGQWEEAIEEYEKALELDPTNSVIYSEMATTYFRHRQTERAVEYSQRAIRADADNLEAHELLGSIYTTMLSNAGAGGAVSPEIIDRAIEEFEQIVRIDPNQRQSYLMLGRLYRFKNDPERAAQVYRDFLEIQPGSEEGAISLAELQMDAGNVQEAVEILSKFSDEQPESQVVLSTLGEAYARLEEFDKAAETYERALGLDRDNVDLLRARAQALFFADRLEEAAGGYRQLLESEPDDALASMRLGQIYRQQMKFEAAREQLEHASQLVPDSSEIRFNLALVNRDDGRFETALEGVEELLGETEQPNARYTRAERQNRRVFLTHAAIINTMMEQYEGAIAAFGRIDSVDPDRDGTVDSYIVDTYRTAKDLDRAAEHNVQALEEFPENRQLQLQRADIIAEQGQVEEGIAALRDMRTDSGEDVQIYSAIVGILQREKDYEAAQEVLDEAKEQFSENGQVYFLQGAIYEQQRNFDAAEAAFRKALEIDDNNSAVLNYLGYMLADNDTRLDEALTMVQTAVENDPINGAYLDSLGWVYYRLDKVELAERFLKRALLFAASDPTIHEHLGDVYEKTGRVAEALAEYEKSVDLAEDQDEKDKVQKKLDQLRSGKAR
jgi:tetratricopeptide (TPR) repeat protein